MAQNKLKYTGLTYDQIQAQITDLINSDTDFSRFRESAIAQTLIEVFTGTTDILNYYLNRRAEECYYDTAQLRSSVISLSRMFGYVMNRPEPAKARLRMIIKGDIEDNQIQIPYYSKFSYGGNNFVLINTMTYRIPDEQLDLMYTKDGLIIRKDSFGDYITIAQGDIREKVINGATNSQVGAPFQIYKIEDDTFSNSYGDKDFFFNDVTQVYVGENKIPGIWDGCADEDAIEEGGNQFQIDRRSLLNWETIDTSDLTKSSAVCVIRTTPDGYVELLFGDGNPCAENTEGDTQATGGFARKGAITRADNIFVQYLSTNGTSANKSGTTGDKVNFSGTIYNSKGEDITSKITFELDTNIFGGGDAESTDSIKYSSPKIYYSLDRLVSKDDYLAYLKSLSAPIDVINAVAWGEQEERDRAGAFALIKMFNAILFTVAGSLYNTDEKVTQFSAKTGEQYNEVVLDLNYNPYEFQIQGYFNIYVMQEMVNQLTRYRTLTTFYEIAGDNFGDIQNYYELLGLPYTGDPIDGVLDPSQVPCDTVGANENSDLELISSAIKTRIETNFPQGTAVISFTYTSDNHDFVGGTGGISTTGVAEITGLNDSDITGLGGKAYLNALASKVSDALAIVKDLRGNRTDNDNFDKEAFIGRWDTCGTTLQLIIWDMCETSNNGTVYEFVTRFNERTSISTDDTPSPCYITKFGDGTLLEIMGLNGETPYTVTETDQANEMNGNISSVVNDMQQRAQVNVKNIYVSPIIHRFYLEGDVYVKSLFDKEAVRTEVTNAIYKWLDINADFNQPIYLSNIIDLIEQHAGIINANVRIVPEDITRGTNNDCNLYYDPNPDTNGIYSNYTIDQTEIMVYDRGTWNAATEIYPDSASDGDFWKISGAGTIQGEYYGVSDIMVYDANVAASGVGGFFNIGQGSSNPIAEYINNQLFIYLTRTSGNASTLVDADYNYTEPHVSTAANAWYRKMFTEHNTTEEGIKVEELNYSLSNSINERSFFDNFAGGIYEEFKRRASADVCSGDDYICPDTDLPNYGRFIGLTETGTGCASTITSNSGYAQCQVSSECDGQTYGSDVVHQSVVRTDFSVIMEQIHKDLSYTIMANMLDTTGNIDAEYNNDNYYVRGGYSLGSEIVQVIMDTNINQNLSFRYK